MSNWDSYLDQDAPDALVSDGNRVEHMPHDNTALEAMWKAIDAARERVWMSMFTLGADDVGFRTLDRLTDAARRGCDVRLVYDYIGSLGLKDRHLEPLRAAGGHAIAFDRVWPPWKKNGPLGIRNHRKLIIADDTAFCGGMNLGTPYVHDSNDANEVYFDDTSVRIHGPCVLDLASIIQHTWDDNTGEVLKLPERSPAYEDGIRVEVLQTDPRCPETRLIKVLGGAIERANQSCQITTPYFIPAQWLMDALKQARRNGADVQIITAGQTDARIARLAGHHCYGELLEIGIRIYEMHGRIIHTKKLTVDTTFCAVGSYNFDIWTSRHVLDASIATVSEDLARSFEKEFEEDRERCKEITLEQWKDRGPLAHTLSWGAMQVCTRL